ncbi:hypothetical protein DSECCO2_451970 [anaerobic digester metagenome]
MNGDRERFAVIGERSAVRVAAKDTVNGRCSPIDWPRLNVSRTPCDTYPRIGPTNLSLCCRISIVLAATLARQAPEDALAPFGGIVERLSGNE